MIRDEPGAEGVCNVTLRKKYSGFLYKGSKNMV
jgi:hypothetical protein